MPRICCCLQAATFLKSVCGRRTSVHGEVQGDAAAGIIVRQLQLVARPQPQVLVDLRPPHGICRVSCDALEVTTLDGFFRGCSQSPGRSFSAWGIFDPTGTAEFDLRF